MGLIQLQALRQLLCIEACRIQPMQRLFGDLALNRAIERPRCQRQQRLIKTIAEPVIRVLVVRSHLRIADIQRQVLILRGLIKQLFIFQLHTVFAHKPAFGAIIDLGDQLMSQTRFTAPPFRLHRKHMGKIIRILIHSMNKRAVALKEATLTHQRITGRIVGNTGSRPTVATSHTSNIRSGKLIVFIHL
ncbi:hypothetical protein D3C73_1188050 [compost metagenome]